MNFIAFRLQPHNHSKKVAKFYYATPELVQTLLSDLELGSEVSAEILQRYSGGKESIISIAFSILGQQSQGSTPHPVQ